MEDRLGWNSRGGRPNSRRWHFRNSQSRNNYSGWKGQYGSSYNQSWNDEYSDRGKRNDQFSNSSFSKAGDRKTRQRHPSGLKGKEIGLWYARRNGASSAKDKAPKLSMNEDEARAVDHALGGLRSEEGGYKPLVNENPLPSTSKRVIEPLPSDSKSLKEPLPSTSKNAMSCLMSNEDLKLTDSLEYIAKDDSMDSLLESITNSEFKSAYVANLLGNNKCDEGVRSNIDGFQSLVKDCKIDQALFEELNLKQHSSRYQEMLKVRQGLPSYEMRNQILDLIDKNQVVVISGETGCGKTTQLSQFILDECIQNHKGSECRIVCTQPRRISAISVAERVADERVEALGKSVGYQIRLDKVSPRKQGSILYCTTGILLQWLQSDSLLSDISHLILDEIHERDTLSDFIICIAKELLSKRSDLKVVLMSATLNAEKFSAYFNNCPFINIPGFTFNVKEYYLEDVISMTKFSFDSPNKERNFYRRNFEDCSEQEVMEGYIKPYLRELENSGKYPRNVIQELHKKGSEDLNLELVFSLLKHIASLPAGSVLVFVPGWEEISKLHKMIQNDCFFGLNKFLVIPLHSLMPTVNQKQVFEKPPQGVRKIVIATNIAETSITINDIVYVVNTGRIKMKNYDKERNVSTLRSEWVSLANSRQRKGRAGRVQEGVCFHLYTKIREKLLDQFLLPEIKRSHLAEVILMVKSLQLGSCKKFLRQLMDPPDEEVIDKSIKMLESIGSLDRSENLTPLGFHLSRLPMHPLTGKMILMGAIFSCLGPVLTVAASLSFKDPFIMVLGKEKLVDKVRLNFAGDYKSDHLMIVNVFNAWQKAFGRSQGNQFAWQNFLSSSTLVQLRNLRVQFMEYLQRLNFVASRNPDADEVNINSGNISLVKAVITAGLYPNVARIGKKAFGKNKGMLRGIVMPDIRKAVLHPKSVNYEEKRFSYSWFVYWEVMKSSKVFLYDVTEISNFPLLLFGEKCEYNEKEQMIHVDSFVKIQCNKQVADVVMKLRKELGDYLKYKITHPSVNNYTPESREGRLLSLIIKEISKNYESESGCYFQDQDYFDDDQE